MYTFGSANRILKAFEARNSAAFKQRTHYSPDSIQRSWKAPVFFSTVSTFWNRQIRTFTRRYYAEHTHRLYKRFSFDDVRTEPLSTAVNFHSETPSFETHI